ncbi:hypothetical protein SLEP1_g46107 [Rubroshorea leprosula]|uniref:Cytochrome P450 n=1 Tax=Rubroshorea leprosula TaxID=152421 RepID=A0AAV5LL64_9ROSI|nr:hypothetical protein SLEP1_g46107 [Rubroshorea leprosula]
MTLSSLTKSPLMPSELTSTMKWVCLGYPFLRCGETFAKYAIYISWPVRNWMPMSIYGAGKLNNSLPWFKKVAISGKQKIDPQGIRRRMTILSAKLLKVFDQMYDVRVQQRKGKGFVTTSDVLDTHNIIEDKTVELNRRETIHFFFCQSRVRRNDREGKAGTGIRHCSLAVLGSCHQRNPRMHPPVPLLLPRRAGADAEIRGFTLPEGAQVLVNAWAIGRDPSIWEMPHCFIPERFLGSEIDVKGRDFELIPFGGGRRICPGLSLVLRMLHLMLGSLINCFDWKLEGGVKPETMNVEEKFGIALEKAKPLRAIAIPVPV